MTKRLFRQIADVAQDIGAYVLTVAGILSANYLPLLESGQPIVLNLGLGRVIVAGIVALLLVAWQEQKDAGKEGATDGKRKNWKLRMVNALAHGLAWPTILKLISGMGGAS
jgi:uncharacterized RDD family membrane protein YckC